VKLKEIYENLVIALFLRETGLMMIQPPKP